MKSNALTLEGLVNHCARVAARELNDDGDFSRIFVAVDPCNQMTVFILPRLSDVLMSSLVATYCGAFEVGLYAVTERLKSAEGDALVITGCSRDSVLLHIQDIRGGKLGEPERHTKAEGSLIGLIPKTVLLPMQRSFLRAVWDTNFAPVLSRPENQVYRNESIGRN